MRAISLWQPWASAIALELKLIETRHWWTDYRGQLVIHAAKRWTVEQRDFCRDNRLSSNWPLGALVAVVDLYAVRHSEDLLSANMVTTFEATFGNYEPGRYGWLLRHVRALPTPIPYKGAQGFFNVPDELINNALVSTS